MLTASSRFWTEVAVSISYDITHYTSNASNVRTISRRVLYSEKKYGNLFEINEK